MQPKFRLLITLSCSLFFCVWSHRAVARTILVPANYPTIQGAVNAARSGDTIKVFPGIYVENIVVTKPNLRILAVGGPQDVRIQGSGTVVRIAAPRVQFSGFFIFGGE